MSLLVLIRHSKSDPSNAALNSDWPLSEAGRALCAPLTEILRPFELYLLVSSTMLRARQTSELLAAGLAIPWRAIDGLQEHNRPFLEGGQRPQDEFESQIDALFANPTQPVFGDSAEETLTRYTTAIDSVLAQEPGHNIGVVSHGTVMALYAAPRFNLNPRDLWHAIGHPCVLVIDRETGRGLRIIDSLSTREP